MRVRVVVLTYFTSYPCRFAQVKKHFKTQKKYIIMLFQVNSGLQGQHQEMLIISKWLQRYLVDHFKVIGLFFFN